MNRLELCIILDLGIEFEIRNKKYSILPRCSNWWV